MKQYKLTPVPGGEGELVKNIDRKLFFSLHNDSCFSIEHHVDYMKFQEIKEMKIYLAALPLSASVFIAN